MGGSSSWNGAPPSQGADLCHSVPGLVGFATRIGVSEGLYHSEGVWRAIHLVTVERW